MNRRSFIRGSGAALLGVATLGLAVKPTTLRSPASSGWLLRELEKAEEANQIAMKLMEQARDTRGRVLFEIVSKTS